MTDPLQDIIEALYRAKHSEFVAERKRLADELKAAGKKELAARVGKLGRPSVSAWAVNQLWWHERRTFAALLDAAARVKKGDREASKEHRELVSELRDRAAKLLQDAGSAASETTLRRVATTLAALAAAGGFEPDPPGALIADRDPPGFEALEGMLAAAPAPKASAPSAADTKREEQERKRAEEEARKARLAERERLSSALRDAQKRRDAQFRRTSELRAELESAEHELKKTQAVLAELEERLASL
jgi:hypothetical protein